MDWLQDIEKHIIFESLVGSQLYGTSDEYSDVDRRGIAIPPMDIMLGILSNFEQKDGWEGKFEDRVIYNIRKFFDMCLKNNPTILEFLFVPQEQWLTPKGIVRHTHPWMKIVEKRDIFISKKVRHTFAGYAHSQLGRIKRHRAYLLNPPDHKPTREEFGLLPNPTIPYEHLSAILTLPLDYIQDEVKETALNEARYRTAKKDWDDYAEWEKGRNPRRAELEKKFGFDCYAEETEFLTENGWKRYDEIKDNEKLATLNPATHEIEYQKSINRVKYKVNNEGLYIFSNQCSTFLVTDNHKLFVSRMHRTRKNFSPKYDEKLSNWEFLKLSNLMSQRKSHYYIIHAPVNNKKDYSKVSDDYLTLMGLYCSEGSLLKYKGKKGTRIKGVSLSQLERKDKIKPFLDSIKEFEFKRYKFFRKGRFELTYNNYDQCFGEKLLADCGEYSRSKKLPLWTKLLSKRQCDLVLDALFAGDGSYRKYSGQYYTSSKHLMNDVNILALHAGYVTKVWDYFDRSSTSQVYVSKKMGKYGRLNKRCFKKMVYTGNVVCFEVPNTVLVTRFNGEISFQGNTKHAAHLVRLMEEGKECLMTGKITLPRPERYLLTAVKSGAFKYDELIEMVDGFDEEFDRLYDESPLPFAPDRVNANNLYLNILEESRLDK
jgi:predicted nucleotidyltransferase